MPDIWTALVSAGSALSGVGLTLWRQGINEQRRWDREAQTKKREQQREDQHRFVESKRDVYARCSAQLKLWLDDAEAGLGHAISYREQIDNDGPDPTDLMDEKPWRHRSYTEGIIAEMTMIAPTEVHQAASIALNKLWAFGVALDKEWRESPMSKETIECSESVSRFIKIARRDLGVS